MSGTGHADRSIDEMSVSLSDFFDLLPDAAILVDVSGNIASANAAVRRVLGYERSEVVGLPLSALIPERFRDEHEKNVARYRSEGEPALMTDRPVLPALHKSGEEIPVSVSIANLSLSGTPYSLAIVRDASPVRDQLGEAAALAETDQLTGLGNRLSLTRHLQSTLKSGHPFGLLLLDLNGFKPFNDQYGHATGDEVLRLIGKRLKAMVRAKDVATRVGGDEFVLLLDGLSSNTDLEAQAARVANGLGQPFRIGEQEAVIGVSIGGALYPRDGDAEEDLVAVADRNMYRAKQAKIVHCTDPAGE